MFGQHHPTEDKCLGQALRSKPHPTEDKCLASPIQQRTGAGHAIVMINLILVLKIAKQGAGLMRTFWAWRVVEDSRAGPETANGPVRANEKRRGSKVNNYFIKKIVKLRRGGGGGDGGGDGE